MVTSRKMATITSLRSSSARRTSRRHSSEASDSGEARNKRAPQATLALTSVSRHFSPACMSCRSMKTSSLDQPFSSSQRWNASAWILSLLVWEMNKRGKAVPFTPRNDRASAVQSSNLGATTNKIRDLAKSKPAQKSTWAGYGQVRFLAWQPPLAAPGHDSERVGDQRSPGDL